MNIQTVCALLLVTSTFAVGCGKKPTGGAAPATDGADVAPKGAAEPAAPAAPAAKATPAGGCVMLGWGGGAAGSSYKMVKSMLDVQEDGAKLVIKYDWKGGTMTMHRSPSNPSSYSGNWQQQGGSGTGNLNFSEPFTKATGSWSTGGKQNAMTVTPCS